jgi:Protein of unknown function (DUF3048) C-terminal domain/Protein of unknown function (DUF3048) N-terminal domain
VVAGLAVVTGLAVTGCGQAPPDPVRPGVSSSSFPSGPASPPASAVASSRPLQPLTGLPAASTADAARPAVALMVSGTDPQGLSSADVVYEEISSPVRYIAVYQSSLSSTVGPITTTNPTDREALAVLHPLTGYDGAPAGFFIKLLDATKIIDAGYTTYPSLYTTTTDGLATTPQAISSGVHGATTPPPIFQYRGPSTNPTTLATTGVSRPSSLSVTIPGLGTQEWAFDTHTNRWALTSGGPAAQAANLVIQDVTYKSVNVNPKHGIIIPSATVTGTGHAEVFSGTAPGATSGTAATGTWSKPHTTSLTNYFDTSGNPMAFQPGPTWIILAPPGTQVTT